MVEITYQMVLSTLQTIALIVGIVYYITIMRNNQRANKLYTLQQRMQNMDRSYFQAWANIVNMTYETPEEWREKYSPENNPEVYADWSYIGSIFHNLGYLLKHELVDSETVFELYPPGSIIRAWRRYEVMVDYRTSISGPNLWQYFRYINDEAKRSFPELTIPDDF